MNKLVTDGASGPTASEHGLIPVQPLLTDFAMSRFNREQHRLPITTSSSDTHERSIAKRLIQKQEAPLSAQDMVGPAATCDGCIGPRCGRASRWPALFTNSPSKLADSSKGRAC